MSDTPIEPAAGGQGGQKPALTPAVPVSMDYIDQAVQQFLSEVGPSEQDLHKFIVEKPIAMNPKVCLSILQMMLEGGYLDTACKASGVNLSTYHRWRRHWKNGHPEAEKLAWFFEALPRAKAFSEILTLRSLRRSPAGLWQRDAWMLERRYHGGKGRWRMQEPKDAKATEILSPPKPLRDMTTQELEQYQAELELHQKRGKPKLG